MPTRTSSPFRKETADWIHDLQSPLAALRAIRRDEVSTEAHALIRGAIEAIERILSGIEVAIPSRLSSEDASDASLVDDAVESIEFAAGAVVAVLDDDPAIHAAWKKRFSELPEGAIERIVPASNPREMRLAMREFPDLFLMDHDLAGDDVTGLDLIIELGIAGRSWLVTGRALDPGLRDRCGRHGVRVLPKEQLARIPLCVL